MSESIRRPTWLHVSQSLIFAGLGLLFGLTLHMIAVALRDYGPSGPGWSLRGNGALIVLPIAVLGLVAGEVVCAQRRLWLGMLLLPLTIFAGLFVVAGSF